MKPTRKARLHVIVEWDTKAPTDERVEREARRGVESLMSRHPRRIIHAEFSVEGGPEKRLT
jgi:hypothetical protein